MKGFIAVATVVLILHGIVHLLGTATYLKLVDLSDLPYKTTVLSGRWELGEGGVALYGVFWAVAAIGFGVAALAFWFGWIWWQPVLVGVTLFSLALTILDWHVAFAGVIVNAVILALLWLGPRMMTVLSG